MAKIADAAAYVLGARVVAWSALRTFGNSPLARATIVVPVLGYLLVTNTAFTDWFVRGPSPHTSSCPPAVFDPSPLYTHAWRLVFVYYGLTFTGIATALFALFCPFSHKKYGDPIDYAIGVRELFPTLSSREALKRTLRVIAEGRKRFLSWSCSRDLRDDLAIRLADIAEGPAHGLNPASMIGALRLQYRVTDFEKPVARLVIALLYLFGLIFVTVSATWGLAEVTAYVMNYEMPVSPWCWLESSKPVDDGGW